MVLKLIAKKGEAKDTFSFFFEPDTGFDFSPGQYIYLKLPKLITDDPRGNTRQFTISSSPTEVKNIRITTRIRKTSDFKKTLNSLQIGSIVSGDGPYGVFSLNLNKSKRINIFIAGGIGITPFRSMLINSIDKNSVEKYFLIYSNSDSEFVFENELKNWEEIGILHVRYINTSKEGRLNSSKIVNFLENFKIAIQNCVFWVSGPPAFVNAIEDILRSLSVDSDSIVTDKFTGY